MTDNEDPGAVLVLDAATGAVVDTVAVERFPYAIRRSPDGKEMFVSSPDSLDVSVIDVATRAVVDSSDGNFAQFASDFGADSGLFYSSRSSTLHEVDPLSLVSQASVAVGADARGLTVSARIGRVFTSSNDDATVSVVDLDSFSVVTTIPTGTVGLFGGILAPGWWRSRGCGVARAEGREDACQSGRGLAQEPRQDDRGRQVRPCSQRRSSAARRSAPSHIRM